MTDEQQFLTPKEAADFLRLKESGLAERRVRGGGPRYFKVGSKSRSKVIYRKSDIIEWIEQFQYRSTSEY